MFAELTTLYLAFKNAQRDYGSSRSQTVWNTMKLAQQRYCLLVCEALAESPEPLGSPMLERRSTYTPIEVMEIRAHLSDLAAVEAMRELGL